MDGTALYMGVCSLFVANAFGVNLTTSDMIMIVFTGTLASIGTAGVPGAGLIMLAMVLQAVQLPMEGLALVAGIDRVWHWWPVSTVYWICSVPALTSPATARFVA